MNDFRKSRIKSKLTQKVRTALGMDVVYTKDRLNLDNVELYKDFEVISIFVNSKLDESILSKMPKLKLIATASTGFDHIDLEYCKKKNIRVANVPAYGSKTVAEFAFSMMLYLYRRLSKVKITKSLEELRGFDLNGKTIGIIGTGKIGKNAIKIANGFSMNVIAFDFFPNKKLEKELNFKYVSLEDLFKKSDIVSLHVPLTKETHHLINKENLSLMKSNSILVNVSRGPIVDTDALYDALIKEKISGAALDVLEYEKDIFMDDEVHLKLTQDNFDQIKVDFENHVLSQLENVLITPHCAFNTSEAIYRILDTTLLNITNHIQKKDVFYVDV